MASDMSYDQIGTAFCHQYYKMFADCGKEAVVAFYHPSALLTFHQHQGQGTEQIKDILMNQCQFKTIRHQPANIDSHPLPDGVMVVATGVLQTDEDQHKLTYSQTFIIKPENNSYYIFNDIFRLILTDTV